LGCAEARLHTDQAFAPNYIVTANNGGQRRHTSMYQNTPQEVFMQTVAQSIHTVEAVDMSRLRRKACLAAAPALAQA
jgi:hypothetical protein